MAIARTAPRGTLFPAPTSVFVCGNNRALLNWFAYALASATDPEFVWTDVRLSGESPTPDDLFSRDRIPSERLHLVEPIELTPDNTTAHMAVSAVIRDVEVLDRERPASADRDGNARERSLLRVVYRFRFRCRCRAWSARSTASTAHRTRRRNRNR